ncbi:hypothetical protein D3C85_1492760 [compost metagenome]
MARTSSISTGARALIMSCVAGRFTAGISAAAATSSGRSRRPLLFFSTKSTCSADTPYALSKQTTASPHSMLSLFDIHESSRINGNAILRSSSAMKDEQV